MGRLAQSRILWLKNWMIEKFITKYHVDMSLAVIEDPKQYPDFNTFFIRELKSNLRPVTNVPHSIASPVDGKIAQLGRIKQNQLLQAKNHYFDLKSLLGGDEHLAQTFYDGSFATLYLAPQDYHRVHMPLSGSLEKTIFVPGHLFSVNILTSQLIPNLYARNERLITIFNTSAGSMAIVLVGAMIVGSIQTAWMDRPMRDSTIQFRQFPPGEIQLQIGSELSQFKLGSTVILIFQQDKICWDATFSAHAKVKFGQLIGKCNSKN